jgi:hypothetical protein
VRAAGFPTRRFNCVGIYAGSPTEKIAFQNPRRIGIRQKSFQMQVLNFSKLAPDVNFAIAMDCPILNFTLQIDRITP